jgi:hypothetical protein
MVIAFNDLQIRRNWRSNCQGKEDLVSMTEHKGTQFCTPPAAEDRTEDTGIEGSCSSCCFCR